ncbi:MAG: hypothetical protein WAV05_19880 [Anaerolineales bacterium]
MEFILSHVLETKRAETKDKAIPSGSIYAKSADITKILKGGSLTMSLIA